MTLDEILQLQRRDLHDLLREGHDVDPAALDDTEYHGIALDIGPLEAFAWRKFKKVFHREADTGVLRGWNSMVVQDGDLRAEAEWTDVLRDGVPRTYWHYEVHPPEAYARHPVEQGLVIDYGTRSKPWESVYLVRDPLVAVNEGSAELLLGCSWLHFAPIPLPTTWFALVRGGELSNVAPG